MNLVRENLYNFHKTGDVKSGLYIGIKAKIKAWLDEMEVENYTINDDYSIDVDGDVNLSNMGLTEFPSFISFRNVNGYFDCSYNRLTSLEGAPQKVEGGFYCSGNQLTTLDGAPQKVGRHFICCRNQLTTLDGAPQKVGGYFECSGNPKKFTKYEIKSVCMVKMDIFT